MTDEALTWPEAFGRMQAVGFHTATGRMRWRLGAESVRQGGLRFWHRVPDRWRVEDEQGVWHVADGQRQLVCSHGLREDLSRASMSFGQRHPQPLLGVRQGRGVEFDWLRDVAVPDGPGEPVEVTERQAWEFGLVAVEGKRARNPTRCAWPWTRPRVPCCAWRSRKPTTSSNWLSSTRRRVARGDLHLGRAGVQPSRRGARRSRTGAALAG